MIRFGPAGIPLSCKGRTLEDGLEDVFNLGLTAMEVQLIRSNILERPPDQEEIGNSPMGLETDLIIGIRRKDGKHIQLLTDPEETIRTDDVLYTLETGLCHSYRELYEMAEYARKHDIQLSVHSNYYVDLSGKAEMIQRSKNNLMWAGLIANALNACVVVTQLGFYGSRGKKAGSEAIVSNLRDIRDWWNRNRIRPPIGLETSGRQEIFGSVDEITDAVRRIKGTVPVINFAHVHSREGGSLRTEDDFEVVIGKALKAGHGFLYTSFSGVEYTGNNEIRLTPIKRGDLRFETLAELIVRKNYDMTLISSSPLLEHDAIYMKVIYERVLSRTVTKEEKTVA